MGTPCLYSLASRIVRGIRCESRVDWLLAKTTVQGYKWFISAWAEQSELPGGESNAYRYQLDHLLWVLVLPDPKALGRALFGSMTSSTKGFQPVIYALFGFAEPVLVCVSATIDYGALNRIQSQTNIACYPQNKTFSGNQFGIDILSI